MNAKPIIFALIALLFTAVDPFYKHKPSLRTQIQKWEASQKSLAKEFLKEVPPIWTNTPSKIKTLSGCVADGKRFLFSELPGNRDKGDYYNLMGYTYDPWSKGYIYGYNYTYCDWLKKRGVIFWRYEIKKECTEYGCRILGQEWEEYSPI